MPDRSHLRKWVGKTESAVLLKEAPKHRTLEASNSLATIALISASPSYELHEVTG